MLEIFGVKCVAGLCAGTLTESCVEEGFPPSSCFMENSLDVAIMLCAAAFPPTDPAPVALFPICPTVKARRTEPEAPALSR